MMSKKIKHLVKPWSIRQFLRPKADDTGPGSVLASKFSAKMRDVTVFNPETAELERTGKRYASLSGDLTLRDCNSEISLSFYAGRSGGRKQALAHLKALEKVRRAVDRLYDDYAAAIFMADEQDLWAKPNKEDCWDD